MLWGVIFNSYFLKVVELALALDMMANSALFQSKLHHKSCCEYLWSIVLTKLARNEVDGELYEILKAELKETCVETTTSNTFELEGFF
jgi:hypothetical protein